jgi:hypothetical protein
MNHKTRFYKSHMIAHTPDSERPWQTLSGNLTAQTLAGIKDLINSYEAHAFSVDLAIMKANRAAK